jgi:hypothetical protein
MTRQANGTFDIETKPEASFGEGIGRFSITKTFHGDLTGSSIGEMLAIRTETPGSAGYVLMERITGKLEGRTGTFVLQHDGIMKRGKPELKVTVVPDSGTGELAGIQGEMSIDASAVHRYVLKYSMPETP